MWAVKRVVDYPPGLRIHNPPVLFRPLDFFLQTANRRKLGPHSHPPPPQASSHQSESGSESGKLAWCVGVQCLLIPAASHPRLPGTPPPHLQV